MTQKVLEYDRNPAFDVQDTYYWCGPASTQMILQARGIVRNESDLAREIGTTKNGTDWVGMISPVLNRYLPDAHYEVVLLEHDPCSPEEKEALWQHIVHSIDAGYGVSNNIVAPPSNYPRGVLGSPNPAYRGGTIYHYRAILGYSDDNGFRAVWVADSGFQPFGYWEAFDQTATLIPPKGYAWANAAVQHNDSVEEVMADNQTKLNVVHDKIAAYPDVPEIAGKWPSRARCRDSNNGVDDTVGMVLYTDANVYDLLIAWSAVELHDPFAMDIINRGAAGKLPANDPASVSWFNSVKKRVDSGK